MLRRPADEKMVGSDPPALGNFIQPSSGFSIHLIAPVVVGTLQAVTFYSLTVLTKHWPPPFRRAWLLLAGLLVAGTAGSFAAKRIQSHNASGIAISLFATAGFIAAGALMPMLT